MKKRSKAASWDQIGKEIGSKMEKEFKGKNWCNNQWTYYHESHGGGFGRLLFIIGLLTALNYANLLPTMPWWVYFLLIFGFAIMRF